MACITTTEGRPETPPADWMEKVASTGLARRSDCRPRRRHAPSPTRWPAPHNCLSDRSHNRHRRLAFMGSAAGIEFWPTTGKLSERVAERPQLFEEPR